MAYRVDLQASPFGPFELEIAIIDKMQGAWARLADIEFEMTVWCDASRLDYGRWPLSGCGSVIASTSNGLIANLEYGLLAVSIPSFRQVGLCPDPRSSLPYRLSASSEDGRGDDLIHGFLSFGGF